MDAPTTETRPITDTPDRATTPEHPRGRGFSVVSRLAREVVPARPAPRHRRDDAGPEVVEHTG
jgi:hypothetical protein